MPDAHRWFKRYARRYSLWSQGRRITNSYHWVNIDGMEPSTVGMRLEDEYKILCRVGLHCAPAAHRTLGTFPDGCVRFGLGAFITDEQVEHAVLAVRKMAKEVV